MAEKSPALLSHLLESKVEEKPDAVAIIFENGGLYPDEQLTYKEILSNSIKMAMGLRELGMSLGDKLALVMRNHPEVLYSFMVSALTGIVSVPIDPRSKGEKLSYQLNDSDAKMVITTADLLPEVEKAAKNAPGLEKVILNLKPDADQDLRDQYTTVQAMLEGPEVLELPGRVDDPNLPLEIIYTSGVTGNPKGVLIKSSRTLMYVVLAQMVWRYTPEDILYTGLSLTHGNAQAVTMMPAISIGIPAVIGQRFSKSRIWDICRKYGCTSFSLLGGMMAGIYNEPPRPDDADNPVKVVISAGTSDIPVAEEAAVTARIMGHRVETVYDCGVAGLHRLLAQQPLFRQATVFIVVAGMEGALPSVVGGLVDRPVIAVPTSVGYGASFGGLAALLAMLNSCANGVAVVNIDNGFGAGHLAALINRKD